MTEQRIQPDGWLRWWPAAVLAIVTFGAFNFFALHAPRSKESFVTHLCVALASLAIGAGVIYQRRMATSQSSWSMAAMGSLLIVLAITVIEHFILVVAMTLIWHSPSIM